MFKARVALFALAITISACGATEDAPTSETGLVFLDSVPSDAVLCSFIAGETWMTEILDALGEPTHYASTASGTRSLQYWIGSDAELGTGLVRMVVFDFDATGRLETPWVQGVPLPQCWRYQASAEGGFVIETLDESFDVP